MMYKFEFSNREVESMLKDQNTFWDPELQTELSPVLKKLKKTGEISGADCGVRPGIIGLVYELKGHTFKITYTVNPEKKQ
ncbi:MAG: hypothetical protein AAGC93_10205 [Cyanobacteria bacterium P01_F01_bin.53]